MFYSFLPISFAFVSCTVLRTKTCTKLLRACRTTLSPTPVSLPSCHLFLGNAGSFVCTNAVAGGTCTCPGVLCLHVIFFPLHQQENLRQGRLPLPPVAGVTVYSPLQPAQPCVLPHRQISMQLRSTPRYEREHWPAYSSCCPACSLSHAHLAVMFAPDRSQHAIGSGPIDRWMESSKGDRPLMLRLSTGSMRLYPEFG